MIPVNIKNVTKYYGDLCAISDINLEITPGEVFGLLGPNGAGKTTLIKLCVGLLKPDRGSIRLFGEEINKYSTDVKKIFGYIPDSPFLYEKLTGREFLRFVGSLYKVDKNEKEERIEYFSSIFRINNRIDDFISSYSHGMRQKISIISALLHNPKILFVDEPFTGLDPYSMKKFKEILYNVAGNGGAVVLSTHLLDIAEKLCTTIGILNNGQLIAAGTVEELRQSGTESSTLEDIFLNITEKSRGGACHDF